MFRLLTEADFVNMPWKNGLGETMQMFISPPYASVGSLNFDWRLSMAKVGQAGPFSLFPGYDRHIMVIEGNGMDLSIAAAEVGSSVQLREKFVPYAFSGDLSVSNTLVDGPLRDFNLIVRREWAASSLTVKRVLCDQQHIEKYTKQDYVVGIVCLGDFLCVEALETRHELRKHQCFIVSTNGTKNVAEKVEIDLVVSSVGEEGLFAVIRLWAPSA